MARAKKVRFTDGYEAEGFEFKTNEQLTDSVVNTQLEMLMQTPGAKYAVTRAQNDAGWIDVAGISSNATMAFGENECEIKDATAVNLSYGKLVKE